LDRIISDCSVTNDYGTCADVNTADTINLHTQFGCLLVRPSVNFVVRKRLGDFIGHILTTLPSVCLSDQRVRASEERERERGGKGAGSGLQWMRDGPAAAPYGQCSTCRCNSARVPWNLHPTSLLTQLVFVPRQLHTTKHNASHHSRCSAAAAAVVADLNDDDF